MIKETEQRVLSPVNCECFSGKSGSVALVKGTDDRYSLSRSVVFSLGVDNGDFGKRDIGLPRDRVAANEEGNVSPK